MEVVNQKAKFIQQVADIKSKIRSYHKKFGIYSEEMPAEQRAEKYQIIACLG